MNNWLKICKQITPLIKGNVSEDIFHNAFVSYLETTFNWENANIKSKFPVKMGTTTKEADIVLKGNDFSIVIEMKKPDIMLNNDHEDQLISYMRILGIKYGLLIGNKIKYFYDHDSNIKPYKITSIDFNPNDEDGKILCEILDYTVCSNDKLYNYSKSKIEKFLKAKRIEDFMRSLERNNFEKIREILSKAALFDEFEEEIKNGVISNMVIHFIKEISDQIPPAIKNNSESHNQNITENTEGINFINEVMDYYNSICDKNFTARGKHGYRQIPIHKNSKFKPLHYELNIRPNSQFGVEIHNESDDFIKLNSLMLTFNGKIKGYTINYRERRGRIRIQILIPRSAGKEICSLVMVELIRMTHEKIIEECRKLNLL